METKKSSKKKIVIFIIIGIIIAMGITLLCVYRSNSTPDTASSVSKNCEIIHNIYVKEKNDLGIFGDWKAYHDGTLFNMGLCLPSEYREKAWNGTWVITKDFINQYVEKYSAQELIDVYEMYVYEYMKPGSKTWKGDNPFKRDKEFYKNNPKLLNYISETTGAILELTDSFVIKSYHPTTDKVIRQTSETRTDHGAELITDTYNYKDYTVTHVHGRKYYDGYLGWVNGQFYDIHSSTYASNTYYLTGEVKLVKDYFEDLEERWITMDGQKYYEETIYGLSLVDLKRAGSPVIESADFPQPVKVLSPSTNSSRNTPYYKD